MLTSLVPPGLGREAYPSPLPYAPPLQPSQQTIFFRDLKLTMDPEAEVEEEAHEACEDSGPSATYRHRRKLIEKHKLILILVRRLRVRVRGSFVY